MSGTGTEVLILKERLRRFLETHNKTKIPDVTDGALRMHIAHARTNSKSRHKDIIINFLLLKAEEILLGSGVPGERGITIAGFLMDELSDFYRNTLG
jgi:hypothetical protein